MPTLIDVDKLYGVYCVLHNKHLINSSVVHKYKFIWQNFSQFAKAKALTYTITCTLTLEPKLSFYYYFSVIMSMHLPMLFDLLIYLSPSFSFLFYFFCFLPFLGYANLPWMLFSLVHLTNDVRRNVTPKSMLVMFGKHFRNDKCNTQYYMCTTNAWMSMSAHCLNTHTEKHTNRRSFWMQFLLPKIDFTFCLE